VAPPAVVCGKRSAAIRFRRRSSAGSMASSVASMSIARSIMAAASGRPAPRYAPNGVVLVTTQSAS